MRVKQVQLEQVSSIIQAGAVIVQDGRYSGQSAAFGISRELTYSQSAQYFVRHVLAGSRMIDWRCRLQGNHW